MAQVFFNFNRETADHGPFNAWDRVSFVPRKDAQHRDGARAVPVDTLSILFIHP
jgi:hypothetical protein